MFLGREMSSSDVSAGSVLSIRKTFCIVLLSAWGEEPFGQELLWVDILTECGSVMSVSPLILSEI